MRFNEDESEQDGEDEDEEVIDRTTAEVQAVERLLALEKEADARLRAGMRSRKKVVRYDTGQVL